MEVASQSFVDAAISDRFITSCKGTDILPTDNRADGTVDGASESPQIHEDFPTRNHGKILLGTCSSDCSCTAPVLKYDSSDSSNDFSRESLAYCRSKIVLVG